MKYIDAEKLKAEIEKGTPNKVELLVYRNIILSLIDSLQQEQPEVDLEEEIDKIWETCEPVDKGMGVETANIHIEQFDYIARHFAQWGAEHLADARKISPNDLKETKNPEPFFYCKYGGIMEICSDCKRNHLNSAFEKEDIQNWFAPSNRGTKQCGEYIQTDKFEKPAPKDLEEAASRFSKNASNEHNRQYLRVGFVFGAKWMKEQMLKNGLDAVKTCDFNKVEKTIAGVFVKYGMDRQKEQMMKEAIHYVVQDDLDSHGASYNIPFIRIGIAALKPKGIGVGDKVRIIIVKEDKK